MAVFWLLVVIRLAALVFSSSEVQESGRNFTPTTVINFKSSDLEQFAPSVAGDQAKHGLLWIPLLLLIGIPIIMVILFWCLTQAYREDNFTRPATPAPSDASTEEEDLDLESANDTTAQPDAMTGTVSFAPGPPSVLESGRFAPPLDPSLSDEEQLDTIIGYVIRKYRRCLKEPYQTNTDILPMDNWHDGAPKLRMETMLLYLPVHLAKILVERQTLHLSHLTEQLEELQRDEEKYHSLSEDEKHMANVKENRFETMIELLNNLQDSIDKCLYVNATSRWESQENGGEINETSL